MVPLDAYPNPFTNFINLELEENTENVKIEIFDIRGKSILRRVLDSNSENIPTEQLPDGLFILVVTKDNKLLARERIVKTGS